MDRIVSSSYGNNTNIKRISDKVNFKIGQTVYGRLVKKIDINQAIVRLLNGVEFHAEVEEGLDDFKQGLLKFQVKGLKDNRLQLRLFNSQSDVNSNNLESDLMSFIKKEGLEKTDLPLLESMLKYDISLTKDNISKVKTMLQFNEKITENPEAIDDFIEKYLNSKDIESNSTKGKEISSTLKSFFKEFNNMSVDDILLFIENDLEFTEESIKSYNSIFKDESNIAEKLNEIKESIVRFENIDSKDDILNINKEIIDSTENNEKKDNILKSQVESKDIISEEKNINIKNILGEEVNSKPIDIVSNDFKNGLKELNNILKENNIDLSPKAKETLVNMIKDISIEQLDKSKIEDILSKVLDKPITLTDEKAEVIKNIFTENTSRTEKKEANIEIKDQVKLNVESKVEEGKEIIRKTLALLTSDRENINELMNAIKDSMGDIKVFNKISQEYYYMDIPMKFNENEYPCKLVIKDKRKDGKEIDSKNLKLALSVKTMNFGTVDAFVKILNKTIDIEIRCTENSIKVFDSSKEILKKRIEDIDFYVNINIKKREVEEFDITKCRDFFGENNIAAIDIKV